MMRRLKTGPSTAGRNGTDLTLVILIVGFQVQSGNLQL